MVSIIVPCYNHEKYIDSFLDGILSQSFDDAELLICDDCSSDSSWDILQNRKPELEKKLKRVVLSRHVKNAGITVTLNEMIKMAEGDWIKPVASDDIMGEDYLKEMDSLFRENPDVDIAFSNGYYIEDDERFPLKDIQRKCFYPEEPDLSEDGFIERLYRLNTISAPAAAVRKRVYDRYGLYDESIFIEDWEMWLRAAKNGLKFMYLNKPLMYYRLSPYSATSQADTAGLEERRKKIHLSEIKILDKYGSCVSKKEYAQRKLDNIDAFYWTSKKRGFKKSVNIARRELLFFNGWFHIGLKPAYWFIRRVVKRELGLEDW